MEGFDGVMYTWIGVRYPCCIGIGIKQRQLVGNGLQNCQLRKRVVLRFISDLQLQSKSL